jgi:AAA domain
VTISFTAPFVTSESASHHESAAAANLEATRLADAALKDALSGSKDYKKVLVRAAAGAGKSVALVRMVSEALAHSGCKRVAVAAFANKQVFPLAARLGEKMGADEVCLFVAAHRLSEVPAATLGAVTVALKSSEIPVSAKVVLAVAHKLGAFGEAGRILANLGPAANGRTPFDVLMVDEAWQLPLHLFTRIEGLAPITVGVGDVGQLPPVDPAQNPWRGDPGYNPYRAWPTSYEDSGDTFAIDLPAVWRPTAEQLPLWRAFYQEWDQLDCVAAPGDRTIELHGLKKGNAAAIWRSVATGVPTLLEIDGLKEPEAPDIDQPLLAVVEDLLASLLKGRFARVAACYDGTGKPADTERVDSSSPAGDPLIVVLATRNQAVDDAIEMTARLIEKYALPDGVLRASTVDSWQGQTNAITVAIHPLSGSDQLDEFNSAFGRLAVTCTRATHGLLMVARSGLGELLSHAPARPGTPFGEPGRRDLPRQSHQRILESFARGTLTVKRTS